MKQFVKKIGSLPMPSNPMGTIHILVRCEGKDDRAIEISPIDCTTSTIFPNRDHANHQCKIATEYHWEVASTYDTRNETFGTFEDASVLASELGSGYMPRLIVDQYELAQPV